MNNNQNKLKELQLLHQALLLDENVVLSEVIERIIKHNHPLSYEPVIEAFYSAAYTLKYHKEVFASYFKNCFSEELLKKILQKILSSEKSENNTFLLSLVWENALDIYNTLPLLIDIAINKSYAEAIEIYSIIENTESPISQEKLLESALLLHNYIKENQSHEKAALLSSIREQLVDINKRLYAN